MSTLENSTRKRHRFPFVKVTGKYVVIQCENCGCPIRFHESGKMTYLNDHGSTAPQSFLKGCEESNKDLNNKFFLNAVAVMNRKLGNEETKVIPIETPITLPVLSDRMSHYDARMLEAYSALKLCYDEFVKIGNVSRAKDIAKRTLEGETYKEVVLYIDKKTKIGS